VDFAVRCLDLVVLLSEVLLELVLQAAKIQIDSEKFFILQSLNSYAPTIASAVPAKNDLAPGQLLSYKRFRMKQSSPTSY
jgi:hypothetical protein